MQHLGWGVPCHDIFLKPYIYWGSIRLIGIFTSCPIKIYALELVTLKQKFLIHGGAREKGLKVCLEKRKSQYEWKHWLIGIIEFVNYWPKKIKFEADLNAGCWNGPFAVLFWDELLLIPKSPSHENFATRLIDGHRWANRCSICDGVYHACHDIFLKPYIYWKRIRVRMEWIKVVKWKNNSHEMGNYWK